jgi:hypothetical protein
MIRECEADQNIVSLSTQLDLAAVGSLSLYHDVKVRSPLAHCCFACGKGSTLTCRVVAAPWADGGPGGTIDATTNNNC